MTSDNDLGALAAFLLTCITEDEAFGDAATSGPWRHDPSKHWRKPGTAWFEEAVFAGPLGADATCVAGTGETDDQQSMRDADHIARWDPVHVLAECQAKRDLIELALGLVESSKPEIATDILTAVASVYTDRPGFREEWAPAP